MLETIQTLKKQVIPDEPLTKLRKTDLIEFIENTDLLKRMMIFYEQGDPSGEKSRLLQENDIESIVPTATELKKLKTGAIRRLMRSFYKDSGLTSKKLSKLSNQKLKLFAKRHKLSEMLSLGVEEPEKKTPPVPPKLDMKSMLTHLEGIVKDKIPKSENIVLPDDKSDCSCHDESDFVGMGMGSGICDPFNQMTSVDPILSLCPELYSRICEKALLLDLCVLDRKLEECKNLSCPCPPVNVSGLSAVQRVPMAPVQRPPDMEPPRRRAKPGRERVRRFPEPVPRPVPLPGFPTPPEPRKDTTSPTDTPRGEMRFRTPKRKDDTDDESTSTDSSGPGHGGGRSEASRPPSAPRSEEDDGPSRRELQSQIYEMQRSYPKQIYQLGNKLSGYERRLTEEVYKEHEDMMELMNQRRDQANEGLLARISRAEEQNTVLQRQVEALRQLQPGIRLETPELEESPRTPTKEQVREASPTLSTPPETPEKRIQVQEEISTAERKLASERRQLEMRKKSLARRQEQLTSTPVRATREDRSPPPPSAPLAFRSSPSPRTKPRTPLTPRKIPVSKQATSLARLMEQHAPGLLDPKLSPKVPRTPLDPPPQRPPAVYHMTPDTPESPPLHTRRTSEWGRKLIAEMDAGSAPKSPRKLTPRTSRAQSIMKGWQGPPLSPRFRTPAQRVRQSEPQSGPVAVGSPHTPAISKRSQTAQRMLKRAMAPRAFRVTGNPSEKFASLKGVVEHLLGKMGDESWTEAIRQMLQPTEVEGKRSWSASVRNLINQLKKKGPMTELMKIARRVDSSTQSKYADFLRKNFVNIDVGDLVESGIESWDPPAYIDPRVEMQEGWLEEIKQTPRKQLAREVQTLRQLYVGMGDKVPHARNAKQKLQFISKFLKAGGLPKKRRRRNKINVQKSRLAKRPKVTKQPKQAPKQPKQTHPKPKKQNKTTKPTGPFFI